MQGLNDEELRRSIIPPGESLESDAFQFELETTFVCGF
jgi:hypothetical protein